MTTITEALGKLDKSNDQHWTADGLPRLETVRFICGNQSLTREDVTKAAPGFSRATVLQGGAQAAGADSAGASGTTTEQTANAAPAAHTLVHTPASSEGEGADGKVQQEGTAIQAEGDADPEIAALEKELALAQEELAEIERAFVQAEAYRTKARAEVDRLTLALEAVRPKQSTGDAIRGYLASQVRQLEARAQVQETLKNSGVDLSVLASLTKGAQIDAAMARRNTRGGARPMFNLRQEK